ncbi:MAG: phage shock protein [Aeromicrobium sp.]|jgi:phage shock protein A|nr:phage shock protein [Aeromicrobium sp.]
MSIGKRVSQWWKSRRSGADDPQALKDRLDETYRTQTALLRQVRRGVADVATSRKRVEMQLATIAQQAAQLDDVARQAVANGNDDDARAALTRKVQLEQAAADLRVRRDDLVAEEDKLGRTATKIEQDVESFRVRKDTLAARHSAAAARVEINSATTGINSSVSEVGQAMEAAERRTRELESTADAVDELVAEGVVGRPGESADAALARQFDAALDSAEVDRQLEQLTHQEGNDGPQQIQG